VRVRVPATSANLGSGFDTVGLALTLYDEVVAWATDDGRVQVDITGEGAADLPRDAGHLVARHARAAMAAVSGRPGEGPAAPGQPGRQPGPGAGLPGVRLSCVNRLPQSRGLGSSAAAVVAGVLAGLALAGGDLRRDGLALQLAAAAEGHGDNVAACLLGGATLCWPDTPGGSLYHALRLDVHPDIVPVVFVPADRLATTQARAMLPADVPHADAVAQAARAALLVEALTRSPRLLMTATEDWLHQRYRAAAMPASVQLMHQLRAAGHAAVISGAGPAVLVLTTPPQASRVAAAAPAGWRGLLLGVDQLGATVESVPGERPVHTAGS
jgi:homoserine kinase